MIFDDQEAQAYDSWYESKLGQFVDQLETELAFSMFSPRSGMKILDAGCGTGNFTLKLAGRGLEVIGVDISPPMLEKAREKVARIDKELKISFKEMNVLETEFPDSYFDGIFSVAVIEFLEDEKKEDLIQEMFRVVKPGGKVLIGSINADSDWGRMYQRLGKTEDSVFSYAHFTTPEKLQQIEKDKLQASKECLFISPDAEAREICREQEKKLADKKRGGFFCLLWEKPKQ